MDPSLYRAAAAGDVRLLERVANEDLLSQSPQKNTALHIAAALGHADFTETILTRCRNTQLLRTKNSDDDTALHCAARAGFSQIVQILMDFESKTMTAAHDDVEEGGLSSSTSSVRLLRTQNKEGDTALHEALSNQHEKVAIEMVKADPKLAFLVNDAKKSSFHVAANEEMVQVVKEILVGTHRSPNSNTSGGCLKDSVVANPRKDVLAIELAFKAFLFFDALAMCLSIFAIFCYNLAAAGRNVKTQHNAYMLRLSGNYLTLLTCSCMLFALVAGVFVSIPPKSMRLAKALLFICSLLPSLLIPPFIFTPIALACVWHTF